MLNFCCLLVNESPLLPLAVVDNGKLLEENIDFKSLISNIPGKQ